MNLFEYQLTAIKELNEAIGYGIERYEVAKKRNRENTLTVHFVSPTGSGKTLMSFALMDELSKQYDNLVFIWLAPNKLHEQTLDKFQIYTNKFTSNLKPLDSDNIDSENILNPNEILCLNWASIDKDSNTLIKQNETGRFMENIILKTKENNSHIIVFIDESHIASSNESSKANAFIETINPSIRVEITATPKKMKDEDEKVIVNRDEVIESGVIKKEFIFNDFENNKDAVNKELLTKYAYEKLLSIKKQYEDIGILHINPLMIIQIENDSQDEIRKVQYEIESYLDKLGISKDLIAYYMADNKEQSENLASLNSPIQIVFTKVAIATGWDCPRACVLLTFRKSNSDDFKTQVLGRINRMPELKHYGIQLLDSAYIYANMERYIPDVLTLKSFNINTTKPKQYDVKIKTGLSEELSLKHFKKQHIIDSFYDTEFDLDELVEEQCKIFWKKIKDETPKRISARIILNLHLKDPQIETIDVMDTDYLLSNKEIENIFTKKLKSSGFKVSSGSFLQGSLFDINIEITPYETDRLLKALKDSSKGKIESYFDLYCIALNEYNFIYFSELIESIIDLSYKKRFRAVNKETIFEDCNDFSIWKPILEYKSKYEPKESIFNKNIYSSSPFQEFNKTELLFALALERNKDVKYWYKNGDKGEQYFSIPYKKNNIIKEFYPDFIVKYNDGKFGLYDTKSELTSSDGLAKEKAEYLYHYCKINKISGGLIKLKTLPTNIAKFVINRRENYTNYDPNNIEWEDFSDNFDMEKELKVCGLKP